MKISKPTGPIYLAFRGETIQLNLTEKGLWVDKEGTVYAFADLSTALDMDDGCGIKPFKFPKGTPLDAGCKVHDYLYSSPAYQFFHTRKEADEYLRFLHKQATKGSIFRIFVEPFYRLSRWFGSGAWENKKTDN